MDNMTFQLNMKYIIYKTENDNKVIIETLDKSHSVDDIIKKCANYYNDGVVDVRWSREFSAVTIDNNGNVIKEDNGNMLFGIKLTWWDYVTMPFYKLMWYIQSVSLRFRRACKRFMGQVDPIESCNINTFIFDFLIKNVQSLKNNLSSVANYAMDVVSLERNCKSYEPSKQYDTEFMDAAMKIYTADLDRLILNCRLVLFYDNCSDDEYIDINNKELFQIPYFAFTDTEIDYSEARRRAQIASDEVFDYLKDHIHELWD